VSRLSYGLCGCPVGIEEVTVKIEIICPCTEQNSTTVLCNLYVYEMLIE